MKIYVGNLNYATGEDTLTAEFAAYGEVEEVAIITDRETGRPRGFAFITMSDDEAGRKAIESLNGVQLEGRSLVVNEAKPRTGGGGFRSGGDRGREGGGYSNERGGYSNNRQ